MADNEEKPDVKPEGEADAPITIRVRDQVRHCRIARLSIKQFKVARPARYIV